MPELIVKLRGRELDFAVAENLMGWSWESFAGECYSVPPYLARTFAEHSAWGWKRGKADRIGSEIATNFSDYSHAVIPRYSESIDAAMQVVEEMRRRKYPVVITCGLDRYAVTIKDIFARPIVTVTSPNSLPEAICHAALAAIGSKE